MSEVVSNDELKHDLRFYLLEESATLREIVKDFRSYKPKEIIDTLHEMADDNELRQKRYKGNIVYWMR